MSHTVGRLKASPGTHVLDDAGRSIAQVNYGRNKEQWEANARRLVACWNACEGLETEALEKHGLVHAVGSEMLEQDKKIADLAAESCIAERALQDAGFTRCDGPAGWRPPIGKPPAHITFDWSHIQEFWRLNPSVDWDQLEASIRAALVGEVQS